jgi:hypothetical protein
MRRIAIPMVLALVALCRAAPEVKPRTDPGWPREMTVGEGITLVLYQPQVESWAEFRTLDARMAVAFHLPEGKFDQSEVLGAVRLTAKAELDYEERIVVIDDIEVTEATFPSLDADQTARAEAALREHLPKGPYETSMDRLLANMQRESVHTREVEIDKTPPAVLMARKEAILVAFDGDPLYEAVEGTELEIAINTESVLFRQAKTGFHYLLWGQSWLKAPKVPAGPWSPVTSLPSTFEELPAKAPWTEIRKHIPGEKIPREHLPQVYVTTQPTELIVTYGEPTFKPIESTGLLYVDNTESDVFLCGKDGMYYALFSGRWFRTRGKGHPPEFCTNDLPADFANIPEDHACGRVLASVPGTDQAREAVIASHIPRRARVMRDDVPALEVTYDGGEPEFELIEGTEVHFAVNTSFDVLRVGDLYYCCEEAVWYAAKTPHGPWELCDEIPGEIKSIPSSHPAYDDTYVDVGESTDEYVEYDCWSGYDGCYDYDGVVVYGWGWRWRWRRPYWRHRYWRWVHRPRPTPYGHMHRHHTFGHGRYYDHWAGRYRRSADARAHARSRRPAASPYQGRRGVSAVRPPRVPRERQARVTQAMRVSPTRADIYAGRDGGVYKRGQAGSYQRYDKGKWQKTPKAQTRQPTARKTPPRASQQNLNRSTRARTSGARRSSQYRNYSRSRGSRTGAYRGGGGRGGGRR